MSKTYKTPPKEDPPTWTNSEWAALTQEERDWYVLFWRATVRFDWGALQELCDQAGADYETMRADVSYEHNAPQRAEYTIPKKRFPEYSEWDYRWSAPRKISSREWVRAVDPNKGAGHQEAFGLEKVTSRTVKLDETPRGPSPVRKVSAEEYWKTRKAGGLRGVGLEAELKHARQEQKLAEAINLKREKE